MWYNRVNGINGINDINYVTLQIKEYWYKRLLDIIKHHLLNQEKINLLFTPEGYIAYNPELLFLSKVFVRVRKNL